METMGGTQDTQGIQDWGMVVTGIGVGMEASEEVITTPILEDTEFMDEVYMDR